MNWLMLLAFAVILSVVAAVTESNPTRRGPWPIPA
jgi:hypothetical protein